MISIKKNRGIFWRWIRHCARKRSAAKIFPKLTQVSLLVGYQNFVGSVWYQIKAFCCEAPSARERSPIAKKIWLFIYPGSFGWHVILRPPVPALRPHHREANVKSQLDIAQPCCGQLTAVKSGYPLTSITWPYRGFRCHQSRLRVFWSSPVISY